MEIKKYKPKFILYYLYKNQKNYNKYFQNKMKDIDKYKIFHSENHYKPYKPHYQNGKFHIFYYNLTNKTINDIVSQHLDISFNPWDITNKKKLEYDKLYNKTHKNGWIISGKIYENYVSYVPFIIAYHKKYGIIYGDFSKEINIISDNHNESIKHFLDNNPPLIWTSWDI